MSALGVARAEAIELAAHGALPQSLGTVAETLLAIQRDLFVVGAELATNPAATDRLRDGVTRVNEPMIEKMEQLLKTAEAAVGPLNEFVVPGQTRLSALVEVCRTDVRRAERRAVTLRIADEADALEGTAVTPAGGGPATVPDSWVVPYLNRLADYLWVLARQIEAAQAAQPDHLVNRLAGPS